MADDNEIPKSVNRYTKMLAKYKNLLVIGILLPFLMFSMFKIGVLYSCQEGYLQGNSCIQPKIVEIVQVCEYNSITCQASCAEMIIKDREAFNSILKDNLIIS